jgi:predicted nucleic acid-binding protein
MLAAIADTGPLVSFLDRAEQHHSWVVARVGELQAPLLVCEPVLAETMYLLSHLPRAQDSLFELLENGALKVALRMDEQLSELRRLHRKYRDRPMSLADACIVRMAELFERHVVLTLDSDFSVYRKHGRDPLAILHPAEDLKP